MSYSPNSPKHTTFNQPYYKFLKSLDKYQTYKYLSYNNCMNIHNTISSHYSNTFLPYHGSQDTQNDKQLLDFFKWQKEHEVPLNNLDKIKVHRNPPKTKVYIDVNVESVEDLIKIIETYPIDNMKEYNIELHSLHKIKPELDQLNNMIGLHTVKSSIVNQLLYFIQGFTQDVHGDYKHTVLTGSPGTGKTELAKIIGKMYSKIGVLKNNVFKKVTRSDLVAGYLGQTAMKTRKKIDECNGGVLFIDEAYSLNNDDMYAKECVDTLCEALSDQKKDLMVIIAGYEKDLNEQFFKINPGIPSRFVWKFNIEEYNPTELYEIFVHLVKQISWKVDENVTDKWFHDKKDLFKFNGRSMEQLLLMTKISHSKRIFASDGSLRFRVLPSGIFKDFGSKLITLCSSLMYIVHKIYYYL